MQSMLQRVHAIVLRLVKYNDKTRIADVLTREHGRMSFAVPDGAGKSKKSNARVVWRPLAVLEFEADLKSKGTLPRPRDVRVSYNYSDIPYNPLKTMVAMFVDELLCGAVWGELSDTLLFDFVLTSLKWLDEKEGRYANFHIAFSIRLLDFIGIEPNMEAFNENYFDLQASEYTDRQPLHQHFLSGEEASAVARFMKIGYLNMHRFHLNRHQRKRVLEVVNDYYMLHVPDFRRLKSIDVLTDALT